MDFGATLGSSIAKAAGGALVSGLGNAIFGGGDKGPSESDRIRAGRRNQRAVLQQMRIGNRLDINSQKEVFDDRIDRGLQMGLTPVEIFGSPASGSGGGTTGSGATLGNSQNAQFMQQQQIEADRALQLEMNRNNNQTAIMTAGIQADASRDVAQTQAGVTTRGQDISAEVNIRQQDINRDLAQQQLNLDRQKLQEQVRVNTASIGLTEAQAQKTLNEVATSDPKFVTAMKQLSMGPANLLVELTMRDEGIALNDNSFNNLPTAKRKRILDKLIALSSTVYVEGQGTKQLGSDAAGATGIDSMQQQIMNMIWNAISGGTGVKFGGFNQPTNKHVGPTFSEPYQAGPNMNYR